MNLRLVVFGIASAFAASGAMAQSGPMDTCRTEEACDAAADKLVTASQAQLQTGRYREAAQLIYPAVLSVKTSPLAKARSANALSDILVAAKLYEYAAVQVENANATTRAPATSDLIKYGRLVARTDDRNATLEAYAKAERQAVAAANLKAVDEIAADYARLGDEARASNLRAQRAEIAARAEEACAAVGCDRSQIIDAKVVEYGPVRYPSDGRRKTGECTISLNVTEDGRPVDLVPNCTDPVFVEPAMEAIQESSFSPRYENGIPQPRYNIIVPFSFDPGR